MRGLKLGLGTLALISAAASAFFIIDPFSTHSVGAPVTGSASAVPVPVTPVVKRTIPIYLEYPARTDSIQNVALLAKVTGYVQKQHVPDGADVREDELLYSINPLDYQAVLDQAKAQAQRDAAALEYARANLGRGTELTRNGFLPKDTLEQRASTASQAEAALAMDRAAIRVADLNLRYTEIRAPFAGRLGRNQASVGTLISVGGPPLNTLVQLAPIYVTFNPSETDMAVIERARAAGPIEAEVYLPAEAQVRHKGELTFINNVVDRATGTISARATIANADFALLPGQYVRVRLHVGRLSDTLMVPQAAVGSSQLGKYLYVVGEGNKVEQRIVLLGPSDGDAVSALTGVAVGDRVITGNLQRVGPGSLVQPTDPKAASGS